MNEHYVTVTCNPDADGDPGIPSVKFECRGNRDSECHSYPDCDCEGWDEDHAEHHPFVKHDECWMDGWFDSDAHVYTGADACKWDDTCVPRGMNRSGPIAACYDLDGCVEW